MELSERFIQSLEKEGCHYVYEWQEDAGTVYDEHTHEEKVIIIVTDGAITYDVAGKQKTLTTGQRIDIPANQPHSAVVGDKGVIYIVGEMINCH